MIACGKESRIGMENGNERNNDSSKRDALHAQMMMGCHEGMGVINSTEHLRAHIYQSVERPVEKSGMSQYFPPELYLIP